MADDAGTPFHLTADEWAEFQFYESQLGVIDTKAENVLWLASVVIVISTLTALFGTGVSRLTKIFATSATVLVLASVCVCAITIRVKWASDFLQEEEGTYDRRGLLALRDLKTKALHASIYVLFIALSLYVVALLVGLT